MALVEKMGSPRADMACDVSDAPRVGVMMPINSL